MQSSRNNAFLQAAVTVDKSRCKKALKYRLAQILLHTVTASKQRQMQVPPHLRSSRLEASLRLKPSYGIASLDKDEVLSWIGMYKNSPG